MLTGPLKFTPEGATYRLDGELAGGTLFIGIAGLHNCCGVPKAFIKAGRARVPGRGTATVRRLKTPGAVVRVGWKHSPEGTITLERAARLAPTDGMTRIVSAEKSGRWIAVLTWMLDGARISDLINSASSSWPGFLDGRARLSQYSSRFSCVLQEAHMKRSLFTLVTGAAILVFAQTHPVVANRNGVGSARLNLVEATVDDLRKAIQTGLITIEQLTEMYLARVAAYDDAGPGVNAFLHVNANAEAAQGSSMRFAIPGSRASPLYGIPVLLKDNIDTADMPTTAGSVALDGSIPPDDAFITRKLRAAGAIIIGKATLTEFANFIALGMPTGYSSLGLFGFNPYDPRPLPGGDGRPVLQTGGSSSGSGIGVNANLADARGRHGDVWIDPQPGER